MRVLQINSHYNKGGAGKIVAYIHKELIKLGHDSFVVHGRGKNHDEGVIRIGSNIEVGFEVFVTRIIGIHGFTSWFATKKLIKKIKEIKPDVIHLHVLHGYYLNFQILFDYINNNNIPSIWTFHDCHAFTGNSGYLEDDNPDIPITNIPESVRDYPKSYWFDFTGWMRKRKEKLFTETDNKIIVSPSNWLTNFTKRSFFSKYECITINNGIDTEKTFYRREKVECRKKHGFKQEEKIVLGIAYGFGDSRKGVKYLIQMAHDLYKQGIKFILIGWNEKNNNLLTGLDNVTTIPFTNNQDELAEFYSLADVFVLPSLAENYATVVIESMACGTPVVGFDVGGVPEQLKDRKGIIVEKGNQRELNEAVVNILNGTTDLKTSLEIEYFTSKNNSISTMTEKYLKAYNIVINLPPGRKLV